MRFAGGALGAVGAVVLTWVYLVADVLRHDSGGPARAEGLLRVDNGVFETSRVSASAARELRLRTDALRAADEILLDAPRVVLHGDPRGLPLPAEGDPGFSVPEHVCAGALCAVSAGGECVETVVGGPLHVPGQSATFRGGATLGAPALVAYTSGLDAPWATYVRGAVHLEGALLTSPRMHIRGIGAIGDTLSRLNSAINASRSVAFSQMMDYAAALEHRLSNVLSDLTRVRSRCDHSETAAVVGWLQELRGAVTALHSREEWVRNATAVANTSGVAEGAVPKVKRAIGVLKARFDALDLPALERPLGTLARRVARESLFRVPARAVHVSEQFVLVPPLWSAALQRPVDVGVFLRRAEAFSPDALRGRLEEATEAIASRTALGNRTDRLLHWSRYFRQTTGRVNDTVASADALHALQRVTDALVEAGAQAREHGLYENASDERLGRQARAFMSVLPIAPRTTTCADVERRKPAHVKLHARSGTVDESVRLLGAEVGCDTAGLLSHVDALAGRAAATLAAFNQTLLPLMRRQLAEAARIDGNMSRWLRDARALAETANATADRETRDISAQRKFASRFRNDTRLVERVHKDWRGGKLRHVSATSLVVHGWDPEPHAAAPPDPDPAGSAAEARSLAATLDNKIALYASAEDALSRATLRWQRDFNQTHTLWREWQRLGWNAFGADLPRVKRGLAVDGKLYVGGAVSAEEGGANASVADVEGTVHASGRVELPSSGYGRLCFDWGCTSDGSASADWDLRGAPDVQLADAEELSLFRASSGGGDDALCWDEATAGAESSTPSNGVPVGISLADFSVLYAQMEGRCGSGADLDAVNTTTVHRDALCYAKDGKLLEDWKICNPWSGDKVYDCPNDAPHENPQKSGCRCSEPSDSSVSYALPKGVLDVRCGVGSNVYTLQRVDVDCEDSMCPHGGNISADTGKCECSDLRGPAGPACSSETCKEKGCKSGTEVGGDTCLCWPFATGTVCSRGDPQKGLWNSKPAAQTHTDEDGYVSFIVDGDDEAVHLAPDGPEDDSYYTTPEAWISSSDDMVAMGSIDSKLPHVCQQWGNTDATCVFGSRWYLSWIRIYKLGGTKSVKEAVRDIPGTVVVIMDEDKRVVAVADRIGGGSFILDQICNPGTGATHSACPLGSPSKAVSGAMLACSVATDINTCTGQVFGWPPATRRVFGYGATTLFTHMHNFRKKTEKMFGKPFLKKAKRKSPVTWVDWRTKCVKGTCTAGALAHRRTKKALERVKKDLT